MLADAIISWSSTNGQALQIKANGQSAVVVTAVGGGTANITASSGGVTSPKVSFIVTAPCCQVVMTPATVQTAFQIALARNKLSVQAPVAGPAQRVGRRRHRDGAGEAVRTPGTSPSRRPIKWGQPT